MGRVTGEQVLLDGGDAAPVALGLIGAELTAVAVGIGNVVHVGQQGPEPGVLPGLARGQRHRPGAPAVEGAAERDDRGAAGGVAGQLDRALGGLGARIGEEDPLGRRAGREQGQPLLIADSPAMQPVLQLIERVGPSDANVLITGESGCGKGTVALALHAVSARASRPLVTVNAGGLSEGIQVDGVRTWDGEHGHWDLAIDGVQMRWTDPVPQAGSYTLTTPFNKSVSMSFDRVDDDTIEVTVAGPRRSFGFTVSKLGDIAETE